jgi:hypothetical protein
MAKTRETFIVKGREDHVKQVIAKFEELYKDDSNHILKEKLDRVPSSAEEKMIREYA